MLSSLSLCIPREWSLHCSALSGPFATTGSGKRFSIFGGDGVQSLKRAGGMSYSRILVPPLEGFLGALGAHFAAFFRFHFLHRFFIDVFLISEGVWEVFGRPKWSKNRDLGCFFAFVRGSYFLSIPI